jgi:hypothetical protein
MDHFTAAFIAGLGCALFGWALILISSRSASANDTTLIGSASMS